MRRGEADALPLLVEARTKAFEAMELQRVLAALTALLEYEWALLATEIDPERVVASRVAAEDLAALEEAADILEAELFAEETRKLEASKKLKTRLAPTQPQPSQARA